MMIQVLRDALQQLLDDMDSGNSNISEQKQAEIIQLIQSINQKELSKIESANYIGVCRATFDNYVNKGLIPEGHKRQGFKELSWNKSDLDKFKQTQQKYGKEIYRKRQSI